jgi:hypothetical protein
LASSALNFSPAFGSRGLLKFYLLEGKVK